MSSIPIPMPFDEARQAMLRAWEVMAVITDRDAAEQEINATTAAMRQILELRGRKS